MQIAHYRTTDGSGWASVVEDRLAPLDIDSAAVPDASGILAMEPAHLASAVKSAEQSAVRLKIDEVTLLPPIPRPGKIIAIGLNYADHIAESGLAAPPVPPVFAKFPSSVTGPRDVIHRPLVSHALDYEGELAVVIGRACRHVPVERASEVIGGYLVMNDVSVRDWQAQSPQWSLAKSFDTHTPIGPWLTIDPELDPNDFKVETYVNGALRQSSSTKHLVFDTAALIAYLSQACTLYPGDIIATGTPAGVGGAMKPPQYLVPGDEVVVEISSLGQLRNTVIDEPESTKFIR